MAFAAGTWCPGGRGLLDHVPGGRDHFGIQIGGFDRPASYRVVEGHGQVTALSPAVNHQFPVEPFGNLTGGRMTRTEISVHVFQRNRTSKEISSLRDLLDRQGKIRVVKDGRIEIWQLA